MEYNITNDFLPVGTIVRIRFNENYFMIIGYYHKSDNEIYDYMAVRYPAGLEGFDKVRVFNRLVVKRVIHMGYENEEWFDTKKKLENFNINNNL